eukprot:IDg1000t1
MVHSEHNKVDALDLKKSSLNSSSESLEVDTVSLELESLLESFPGFPFDALPFSFGLLSLEAKCRVSYCSRLDRFLDAGA